MTTILELAAAPPAERGWPRGEGWAAVAEADPTSAAATGALMTDAELLASGRAGFTALYRRHAAAVWNHARRSTTSPAAAEEVLAETFLVAWRRRTEVRLVHGTARPWLLVVATNTARTERRRQGRYLRALGRVAPAPDVPDHADAVATGLDDARRVREVMGAVDALPTALREVVQLCLVGGLPTAEAAAILQIAEPSVRSRLSRARARLRTTVGQP